MEISELTLGPIVGYTTNKSARIFGRGNLKLNAESDSGYLKCHGIARCRIAGETEFGMPMVFKMNPNFDFTGITEFENLEPGKKYEYEIGFFYLEADTETINKNNLLIDVDWTHCSSGEFTTCTADIEKDISLFFGSCRYLLKVFGGSLAFFDERGDKTFRSMLNLIKKKPVDQLMMIGDQIYADDFNLWNPDKTLEQYNNRYRSAFSQPYIKELMSRLPTYMILDDHEIEDNWPYNADSRDYQDKYPQAMHAYQTYQVSHSPVLNMENGKSTGIPDKYWYIFENGCADFFVMDTRTERIYDGANSKMINEKQFKELKMWLNNGNGRVKIIVSSVPFFPDCISDLNDKWGGFHEQRTSILDYIYSNKIRKVVFLSGDVHCSLSVQIKSAADPLFKVTSIISSSFFWPYRHEREKDFQLSGILKKGDSISQYEISFASKIIHDDNFTRLTVNNQEIEVMVYDRKGLKLLEEALLLKI